jgi:effector-binding domain-containing protein
VVDVALQAVPATPIAVAKREVRQSEIGAVMVPALDAVWAFVRSRGLDAGHNVAVYRDGTDGELSAWFGVEVAAPFDGDCSIECAWMPSGPTAVATHVGPYDRLGDTHRAVVTWCEAEGYRPSDVSWECYGDWTDDPAKLETTIGYVLV